MASILAACKKDREATQPAGAPMPVNEADVKVLVNDFDLTVKQAEAALRSNQGDFDKTVRHLFSS